MRKKWWKSKLVWFNTLVALGTAAEASMHLLANTFSPEIYFGLVVAIAGVNVLLRFATDASIGK